MNRGLFVSLDGPGGVGKSTTAKIVVEMLLADGLMGYYTTEPSRTPLGNLLRAGTQDYRGVALACLIAGDRHHHVDNEVRPVVARGGVVVCDRYIASSLVLQHMDGLTPDAVWELNRPVHVPDLMVFLSAEPDVLRERLGRRGSHSRFEDMEDSSFTEFELYARTAQFLQAKGVGSVVIDCTDLDPEKVATRVVDHIKMTMSRENRHG